MEEENKLDWTDELGTTTTYEQRQKNPFIYEMWNGKADCAHHIVSASGGGVKCTKCPAWFCF